MSKLPEPTPPTETQDEFLETPTSKRFLELYTRDEQGFYVRNEKPIRDEGLETAVAAPAERVDDVIARMIQEVAPAPLCVSETAVRQLRPLLEELAQRRGMERVETSPGTRFMPCVDCGKDLRMCECKPLETEPIRALVDEQAEDGGLWFVAETITEDYLQRALRKLHAVIEANPVAAVAPSPAGESQEATNV